MIVRSRTYRYSSPPSSHASINSPEIPFRSINSNAWAQDITRNIQWSFEYMQSRSLVTEQPKNPREGYGKIRWKYIPRCISSIFPHTYIHFPSTSPLRYIARIESMSVTRNLHFPGKYMGEGGGGDRIGRIVDALRGGEKERGAERSSASFSLFLPLDYWKGLGGKFRAQLFNRPYWPEWIPWVGRASTNS